MSLRQEIEQSLPQLLPEGVTELATFIEFLRFKYRLVPLTGPAALTSNKRVAELTAVYETTSYETILDIVHHWPPANRLMLMQDILKSLLPEPTPAPPRRRTLAQALGLLATDQPPSDDEVKQWLVEHRLEKYG